MKKFSHITLALISTLIAGSVHAQESIEDNTIVRSSLDKMFQHLDKAKVPTGLLLDYAMDLVDFDKYSGKYLSDSNYVSISDFQDMLRSIRSASVAKSPPLKDVSSITANFEKNVITSKITIGIALYKYNYILANALSDNLIKYDASLEEVSDNYIDGKWMNPYGEKYLFGITPSSIICSENSCYQIDADYFFHNIQNISKVELDPGDGKGYRTIRIGETMTPSYTVEGNTEIKVRVTLDNGDLLISHSNILVIKSENMSLSEAESTVPPTDSIIKTITYDGIELKAQASYYARNGHDLRKPFIVVEGFDPWRIEALIDNNINTRVPVVLGTTNHIEFYKNYWEESKLHTDYDLVYIDWNNSTEDIRGNARLLIEILKEINSLKERSGDSEPNILMGQSMGGLIARYALCKMESEQTTHSVSSFISHDTPYLGANIPLGALYMAHDLLCMLNGYSNGLVNIADALTNNSPSKFEYELFNLIHSKAVRQMLYNYVNSNGALNNYEHQKWQEELLLLGFPKGDYGKNIENLAISNGGRYDIAPTLYNSHYMYFGGYAKTRFLGDIIGAIIGKFGLFLTNDNNLSYFLKKLAWPGTNKIICEAEVNPCVPSAVGKTLSSLELKYKKIYMWIAPKKYSIFKSSHTVPSLQKYYEDYPGSYYDVSLTDTIQTEPTHKIFEGKAATLYRYDFDFGLTNKVLFIPTASSLCVNEGYTREGEYRQDYYQDHPDISRLPFNAYCIGAQAESHIDIDNDIFNWIDGQIKFKISAPDRIVSETRFSVPWKKNLVWYSSNKAIAVVDASGKVTPTGNGVVRITAESYEDGKLYRTYKDVMVSFPDITLRPSYDILKGYTVTASTVNNEDIKLLDKFVSSGELKYEWFMIDNDGNIVTPEPEGITLLPKQTNTYSFIPNENEVSTVCLRFVDDKGNIGKTYSLTFDTKSPFEATYKYVVVNAKKEIFSIRNKNHEGSFPTEPYSFIFKSIPTTTTTFAGEIINLPKPVVEQMKAKGCYIRYSALLGSFKYLQGTYNAEKDRWEIPLFESSMFLNAMEDAFNNCSEERTAASFSFTLCSNEKKTIQKVTFAVFCKPKYTLINLPPEKGDIIIIKPLPLP